MAAKKGKSFLCGNKASYDKLIAASPGVERKGDTNPYTAHNGNMFTTLHPKASWQFVFRKS